MKKYIIICCCIVALGVVLVGLQWQISMYARVAQEEQSLPLLDEIRKSKIVITPSSIVYIGDDVKMINDIPKGAILTEEAFNMLDALERTALISGYELQKNNLKSGEELLMRQHGERIIMPPPLPPRPQQQELVKSMPQNLQDEIKQGVALKPVESSMPVPPPLPPRQQQQESAKSMPQHLQDEIKQGVALKPVESSMPVPPPLPLRQQQQESAKSMSQNLQDEIKQGVALKPVTNQSKEPSLQDEIKQGIQLKSASDRKLADRPLAQPTLQDEIKTGVQLRPAGDRQLADKPQKQITLQDEIKQGIRLKPVEDRQLAEKTKAEQSVSQIDMIKEGLQKKFKTDEDDEDWREDDEHSSMIDKKDNQESHEPASVVTPQARPAANTSLLDQIKQGTTLKKVHKPNAERRPSSEPSSLSKQIDKFKTQQQQSDEEDDSESDDQSDWE